MIIDGEHYTNGTDCWCNPTIEVLPNGNKVVVHKDISPEEAIMNNEILLAQCCADSTAELLKEIRKIRKLSILDVSKKSGINRNTISEIEKGNKINNTSISTLSKVAHALNCDLRIELIPFENFTKEKQ